MAKSRAMLVLGCLLVAQFAGAAWYDEQAAIMGTEVRVSLWHDRPAEAASLIAAVMAEMRRIDALWNPSAPASELHRVNRLAAAGPLPVSGETQAILQRSLAYSRLSEGAFDISFATLGQRYDYRRGRSPSSKLIARLQPVIDYRRIHLDQSAGTVSFSHPALRIDLGGIAKGYAVDRAAAILAAGGVRHAVVSAGGDSRMLGDRRGRPWMVGIKNPRDPDGVALVLPLTDAALSTSGDYERYFIDPDTHQRVHHILHPATGRPAPGVASVSVIAATGAQSDPLSTAVFVLGVERGLALLNRLPGIDGVIIDSAGRVHYSAGLAPP